MRYNVVDATIDFSNGVSRRFVRNRFSPGVQMLIRPNVKFDFGYNRFWEEPVPGATTFFRLNGFQGGIDFAF